MKMNGNGLAGVPEGICWHEKCILGPLEQGCRFDSRSVASTILWL